MTTYTPPDSTPTMKKGRLLGMLGAAALLLCTSCVEMFDLLVINNSREAIVVTGTQHAITIDGHSLHLIERGSFGEIHLHVLEVGSRAEYDIAITNEAAAIRRAGGVIILEYPVLKAVSSGGGNVSGEVVTKRLN